MLFIWCYEGWIYAIYLRINLTISRDKKKRKGTVILTGVGLSSFMMSYLSYEIFVGSRVRMVLGDGN